MNYLIVTKDIPVLRRIQGFLEEMSESPVFFLEWETEKAFQLIRNQEIDVLVCETPGEQKQYVDFLQRVCGRTDRPEIVALLYNAGDDFLNYLQELPAVLFLKCPFERRDAERILRMAQYRAEQKRRMAGMERNHYYWERHKHLIRQQFWTRFCSGLMSSDPADFMEEARECGVEMKLTDTWQIAVLSRKLIHQRNTEIEKQTRKQLLDTANSWFGKQEIDYIILEQVRPLLIVRNLPKDEFLFLCAGLVRELQQEQEIPLCIYYDADIFCERIFQSVLYVMQAERECMEEKPGVYPAMRLVTRKKEEGAVLVPEHSEELLKNGQLARFEQNIRIFLQEQSRKGLVSRDYLKAMRMDLSQVIFSVLKEKSIPAHRVLMAPELKELEINAHISTENFIAWVEALLANIPESRAVDSVAEAVKNYVRGHVRENNLREAAADALYMNPDYLGRLYKRETGQSLGSFILEEKMKKAGELLAFSDKPIGEIGAELGYGNFSHFSKVFKKTIGCSPREFRMSHLIEKSSG